MDGSAAMKYLAEVNGQSFQVTIEDGGRVVVGDRAFSVDLQDIDEQALFSLLMDHQSYELVVDEGQGGYRVLLLGEMYEVAVEDDRPRRTGRRVSRPAVSSGSRPFDTPSATQDRPFGSSAAAQGDRVVRAPMPGLVVQVPVSVGQEVAVGDVLVVLESMKMENELPAPRGGVVRAIHVSVGDTPRLDEPLVTLS
jgi:biotin carboxyl carrier protein